ncbi:VOC family protein [Streptomyces olivaceus]|uniref:VOC family protein n=1 Tax=Streptomyces olivaceus TaxID=47716 RepID=UPI001CC9B695|nr:VOC family protein [Streptomyces olivaceus]MBZ6135481.1 VOC family protein [Streptomyces olivaceus]
MPASASDTAPHQTPHGGLHHVEIWVPDLLRAIEDWAWLLESLDYSLYQTWDNGRSWRHHSTYLVFEQSPDLTQPHHDRCAPGLNHLAFHVATRTDVDTLTDKATSGAGWTLLFPERHPHAGGSQQYAAYLANRDGFEIELIAAAP